MRAALSVVAPHTYTTRREIIDGTTVIYLPEERDRIRLHAGHVESLPIRVEGDARKVRALVVTVDHRLLLHIAQKMAAHERT